MRNPKLAHILVHPNELSFGYVVYLITTNHVEKDS